MSTGRDVILAYSVGSTWGTAVTVNAANKGVRASTISDYVATPEQLPDEFVGQNFLRFIDNGNISLTPVIGGQLRFDSQIWAIIGAAIGTDVVTGAGADYTHTMDVAVAPAIFGTLAFDDGPAVREIPSLKPNTFTIRGSSGGFIDFELSGNGDNSIVTGQTNTTLASVTYASDINKMPFGTVEIRINDKDGDALDSDDKVCPNSFELVFTRDQELDFTACANPLATPGITSEPQENGFIEATLSLEFPEYTSEEFIESLGDGTNKKATISFTGATLGGSNYSLNIEMPNLKITEVAADVDGPGRIPHSYSMQLLDAGSAPTGMATANPLQLVLVDAQATSYVTL